MIEAWRVSQLPDADAKISIYRAFVEGELEAPKHLARGARALLRSAACRLCAAHHVELSNAFTSAFKELDPIPQFRATAKLGAFLMDVQKN